MPPKSKISREMIIEAAFEIVRESGEGSLNARNIADKLKCSTQPVLYCFNTMDEIREEVYRVADEFHSEYLMQIDMSTDKPMGQIWKRYIKFGAEEKNLFKFLFQSNSLSGHMQGLFDDERLMPILILLGKQMDMEMPRVKKLFAAVYYPIHGIASLLANNSMDYCEEEYDEVITAIRNGVLDQLEKNRDD